MIKLVIFVTDIMRMKSMEKRSHFVLSVGFLESSRRALHATIGDMVFYRMSAQ